MPQTSIRIRDFQETDRTECARILYALPEWFGIAEANAAYVDILGSIPTAVAVHDTRLLGFIGLEIHNPSSLEIHILAVDREAQNRGIGTQLVVWSEAKCEELQAGWLHVKTRGPSTPDPDYERTRAFYLAKGFEPLFESQTLWGSADAALILVKKIQP